MAIQLVWFKRDLRTADNEALSRACAAGPTLCLYVVEPAYWQLSTSSNRQWLFVRDSLQDLATQLAALGAQLLVLQGTVCEALDTVRQHWGPFTLHSHEETGVLWTYARDKAVARWCRDHGCTWSEYAQNGVCRPVSRREASFKDHWAQWVASPRFPVPDQATFVEVSSGAAGAVGLAQADWPVALAADAYDCPARQRGGRGEALALLRSFLRQRSRHYRSSISATLSAQEGCSRLSAHLAYGCISLRELAQAVQAAQRRLGAGPWSQNLASFYSRLAWHCHFIQSLESQPALEHSPPVAAMARLPRALDAQRYEAWRTGHTGWPLVDACMRYLHQHGWINFRMRAMLVSVAGYSLALPWPVVATWLAQMFVDFEPGIHYPQIHMQSGTSRGTVLRIYNPVTQAVELDPQGEFVRQWVPELRNVSQAWIFEPWKMTAPLREQLWPGGVGAYALPLVDFEAAHRTAKAQVTALRKKRTPAALALLQNSPSPNTWPPNAAPEGVPPSAQLDLF